ncbi:hypothetical protein Cgig2_007214 [Carnegiea gigantea]|uniref:Uncharacterized protein n=1 Tax=Carnegiea gigantea TaxID=171969 RepID=A0A9Q1KZN1_9CARY|nr:hypothetical protein Cgig2_007214 [Carnegiea gigantea]
MKKLKMPKKMRVTRTSSGTTNAGPSKHKGMKGMKMGNSFRGIKKMNIAAAKKLRRSFNSIKLKSKVDQVQAETAASTTTTAPASSTTPMRSKWTAVVRKKMRLIPHPRIIHKGSSKLKANNNAASNAKNIIIIHNNTSIASNEDYNRASCVDIKDIASLKPGYVEEEITTTSTHDHHHQNANTKLDDHEEELTNGATSGRLKEVDVTSIDSAAPPPQPADQASKEGEEEEKEDTHQIQDHQIQHRKENNEPQMKGVNVDQIIRLREDKAIIHIQSVFRAHLARRAYRALKSLVKLQAVVRGLCVRRQARMAFHCMNTLARLQARVRARQLPVADAVDRP